MARRHDTEKPPPPEARATPTNRTRETETIHEPTSTEGMTIMTDNAHESQTKPVYEMGQDRLIRLWPEIVAEMYATRPDVAEAYSTCQSARALLAEIEEGDAFLDVIGAPDNPAFVLLAQVVLAARSICGMNYPGAERLLRAALVEIGTVSR